MPVVCRLALRKVRRACLESVRRCTLRTPLFVVFTFRSAPWRSLAPRPLTQNFSPPQVLMPGITSLTTKDKDAFCAEVGAYWLRCLALPGGGGYSLHDKSLFEQGTAAEDAIQVFYESFGLKNFKKGGNKRAAIQSVFDWMNAQKAPDAKKLHKLFFETKEALAVPPPVARAAVARGAAAVPPPVARGAAAVPPPVARVSVPTAAASAAAAPAPKPRATVTAAAAAAEDAAPKAAKRKADALVISVPEGRTGGSSSGGGFTPFPEGAVPNSQELAAYEAEAQEAEAAAEAAATAAAAAAAAAGKKKARMMAATKLRAAAEPEKKKAAKEQEALEKQRAKEQEALEKQRAKFLEEASEEVQAVLHTVGVQNYHSQFLGPKKLSEEQIKTVGIKNMKLLVKLGMVLVVSSLSAPHCASAAPGTSSYPQPHFPPFLPHAGRGAARRLCCPQGYQGRL